MVKIKVLATFLGAMNFLGIPPGQMHNLPGFIQTGLTNLISGKGLLGTGMGLDMSRDRRFF